MPRGDRVIVYRDAAGLWRWRRLAGNNKNVGRSEQGYRSKWYCKQVARLRNLGVPVTVKKDL